MDTFNAWLYRGGHPNRVAALMNRAWGRLWAAGLSPENWVTLEVRGRRTGQTIAFPVIVVAHDGERYLVSMLGNAVNWVANVRAAGGKATLRHGTKEAVYLDEVEPGARAPILRRYLEMAPGARAHFPVPHGAPTEAFAEIADRYPVFRIRSADA